MANKDIISKYILKHIVLDMARYLFGLKLDSAELLDSEKQRVEERRADLVVKACQCSKKFILHIEIQNNNDAKMPLRMLRYYTDIALNWPGYEIVQYLVYIGKPTLIMPPCIEVSSLNYHYHITDMHNIDCSVFLEQNNPEAVVLAVLCDFKGKDQRQVIHQIFIRLQELTRSNQRQYSNCVLMLELLSSNRDLQSVIKEEEEMLSNIKLEDLPSYEIGEEKGIEKGKKSGIEEILLHQLQARFGVLPLSRVAQIKEADSQQLLKWSNQILTASGIDEVFK